MLELELVGLVVLGVLEAELVVLGVDEEVDLLEVEEEVVVVVVWQSRAESCATVWAPCIRLLRSVGLTVGGRLTMALEKPATAVIAPGQSCPLTAL